METVDIDASNTEPHTEAASYRLDEPSTAQKGCKIITLMIAKHLPQIRIDLHFMKVIVYFGACVQSPHSLHEIFRFALKDSFYRMGVFLNHGQVLFTSCLSVIHLI